MQGHPRWTGHSEEFWQNVVCWRGKWEPIPIFLVGEPHEQYEQAKIYDTGRWTPQVGRGPICFWRRVDGGYQELQEEWRGWAKTEMMLSSGCVWCCTEQYCLETWNVRSVNQGTLAPIQWTWIWANSGRLWGTGRPGVLQSMGCKESDMTEQLKNNNNIFISLA